MIRALSCPWLYSIQQSKLNNHCQINTTSKPRQYQKIRLFNINFFSIFILYYDRQGGSALDAAERAVNALEDNDAFNSGHGSVLTEAGTVEMDAIIVDGTNRKTGMKTRSLKVLKYFFRLFIFVFLRYLSLSADYLYKGY